MRTVANDGVQNGEQFPHTSDNGNFFLLADMKQAMIHRTDDRITARGCEGSHVEDRTNVWASTTNITLPVFTSAVAIVRSDAHQSGNLLAVTLAQLRHIGDEFGGGLLADALHFDQQFGFLFEVRIVVYKSIDLALQLFEFVLEPGDVFVQRSMEFLGCGMQAVALGD